MLKEASELTAKVKSLEKEWREFANEAKVGGWVLGAV